MSDIKTTEQGVTRRDFIVRSTLIAGSGFLSIGLPGLVASKEAQAAVGGQAFTPSIWFTVRSISAELTLMPPRFMVSSVRPWMR